MRLSVPSSIILASAIVSLGLYFGLRRPEPTGAPAPAPAAAPTPAPGTAPPSAPVPAARPLPSEEQLRPEVVAQVQRAKETWKAQCWDTADPATRKPGRYVSVLSFGEDGGLDISGVSEFRDGASDPLVAQCIRLQVNHFKISPPGRMVVFEVPFEIP